MTIFALQIPPTHPFPPPCPSLPAAKVRIHPVYDSGLSSDKIPAPDSVHFGGLKHFRPPGLRGTRRSLGHVAEPYDHYAQSKAENCSNQEKHRILQNPPECTNPIFVLPLRCAFFSGEDDRVVVVSIVMVCLNLSTQSAF